MCLNVLHEAILGIQDEQNVLTQNQHITPHDQDVARSAKGQRDCAEAELAGNPWWPVQLAALTMDRPRLQKQ